MLITCLVTKFGPEKLSGCFNVIGLFAKKDSYPLFSISILISQFSSKWPGSSSHTRCDVSLKNFVLRQDSKLYCIENVFYV